MPTYLLLLINLALPALMLLAGGVILLLQLQRWVRKKEGNPLAESPREKRRLPSAVMISLGMLLATPATLLILFFLSRGYLFTRIIDMSPDHAPVTFYSVNDGFLNHYKHIVATESWYAYDRASLESLAHAKPSTYGFLQKPIENERRLYLSGEVQGVAAKHPAFAAHCEFTLLKQNPATYFGRLFPAPGLNNAQFTLPVSQSQMAPVSKYAYALGIKLKLSDTPDAEAPRQIDMIRAWAEGLDFPPLVTLEIPATLTPQTRAALLAFPRIQTLWVKGITQTQVLKPWEGCKEIENLQLDFAAGYAGGMPDFPVFPRLNGLSLSNLDPQVSDEIIDSLTNVRILRIQGAPGFKSTSISRLAGIPKHSWIYLKDVPLDDVPAEDWGKLRASELQVDGSRLSEQAIDAIARRNVLYSLMLADTPLTLGAADSLSRATDLWHLRIGEPEEGALIKLAGLANLQTLDIVINDPVRLQADIDALHNKCPNLTIRINPPKDLRSPW